MRIGGRLSLRARTYVRSTEDSLASPILSLCPCIFPVGLNIMSTAFFALVVRCSEKFNEGVRERKTRRIINFARQRVFSASNLRQHCQIHYKSREAIFTFVIFL